MARFFCASSLPLEALYADQFHHRFADALLLTATFFSGRRQPVDDERDDRAGVAGDILLSMAGDSVLSNEPWPIRIPRRSLPDFLRRAPPSRLP
jgi:hypothetical protein